MDVARTEAADAELVRMIERRSLKGEIDPDEREEIWKESVRAYTAGRRKEMRAAWREYHQEGQAERHRAVLKGLVAHHEEQAAKLMDVRPEGA